MKTRNILLGCVAALLLWTTGLSTAAGAEQGEDAMELIQAEGYAFNTPFYAVADMERSIAFYTGAIGLGVANVLRGDDGAAFHAEFRAGDQTILMIGPEGAADAPHGLSPATGGYAASFDGYFYVADVDAFHARAVAAGAEAIEPPSDQFWGDRTAYIKDPDGYPWMAASKIEASERDGVE